MTKVVEGVVPAQVKKRAGQHPYVAVKYNKTLKKYLVVYDPSPESVQEIEKIFLPATDEKPKASTPRDKKPKNEAPKVNPKEAPKGSKK